MEPVGSVPVSARLSLTSMAWGTRLELACTYRSTDGEWGEWGEDSGGPTYVMVVRTRDGQDEQVASWRGVPGKTSRLTAATARDRTEIRSVEVRTASGKAVLKLGA
jgi:hypothetical protein